MEQKELYDLKYYISDYLAPRLKEFKTKHDRGEFPTSPDLSTDENKLSIEDSCALWSEILEEIIFPFDYLSEPDKYENMENEEIKMKMKRGLNSFANYFEKLWV